MMNLYEFVFGRKWANKKYEEIISKSKQIPSNCPSVYQLTTKKEQHENLTRVMFGERNLNKTNRTILLVGETGTGKSTLIDALLNYAIGVKFEEEIWFQIVEEERGCQIESQTSDVIVYQIYGFEDKALPYSLTIVDTPGYGDTRNQELDAKVAAKLLSLFGQANCVNEINAVGLVMKASDNRLTDRLMYVLNSVMSLFGKDLEENIVALITHSDGRKPQNALQALKAANIKCSKNNFTHFLFNNCQHEDRSNDREFLERAKQVSVNGLREFTVFLEKTAPKKVQTTMEVLEARIRLKACIENLQDRIKLIELKEKEITQVKDGLRKHQEEIKKNENFTIEIEAVYKDKEQFVGEYLFYLLLEQVVNCSVCKENCHVECALAFSPQFCKIMQNGLCTVCTKKCPASDHVKESKKYVTKTRKVATTIKYVKKKYDTSKYRHDTILNILESCRKEYMELTNGKLLLIDEAYEHMIKLEEIALNVESMSTLVHLDFLIEKMNEIGEREKVRRLEKIRHPDDEVTRVALRYAPF